MKGQRMKCLESTKNLVVLLRNGRVFIRQYEADDRIRGVGVSHLTAQDFDELQDVLCENKIRWNSIKRWYVVRGRKYENDKMYRRAGNA